MQDPKHVKLGDRTGPWSEDRPKEEMMADFHDFNDESKMILDVRRTFRSLKRCS